MKKYKCFVMCNGYAVALVSLIYASACLTVNYSQGSLSSEISDFLQLEKAKVVEFKEIYFELAAISLQLLGGIFFKSKCLTFTFIAPFLMVLFKEKNEKMSYLQFKDAFGIYTGIVLFLLLTLKNDDGCKIHVQQNCRVITVQAKKSGWGESLRRFCCGSYRKNKQYQIPEEELEQLLKCSVEIE